METCEICEICGRSGVPLKHPCRFEKGCSCWYGQPCDGSGKAGRRRKAR